MNTFILLILQTCTSRDACNVNFDTLMIRLEQKQKCLYANAVQEFWLTFKLSRLLNDKSVFIEI